MTPPCRVVVLGTGRLAGSLAGAISARCAPEVAVVAGICGRTPTRVAALAAAVGAPAVTVGDLAESADLILIAVADRAVADVAGAVASVLAGGTFEGGRGAPTGSVVHCSGVLPLDVLADLAATGCAIGAWHPLQAFPTSDTALAPGVTWTITAEDAGLVATLEKLTRALGGRPKRLAARHRPAYHAAAVLAANYPAGLVAHAVGVLTDCGFSESEALAALLPLARSALDGLATAGVPGGITGPAVRGDVATITSHLRALDDRPATRELYRAAGLGIVPFAQAQGLAPEVTRRLEAALTDGRDLP